MSKCEGCVFWEGNESTYRAKCKKLSDEQQNVTTAFDDSCKLFFAKVPEKPALVMPDIQSQARGMFTGFVGRCFIADAHGDLIDFGVIRAQVVHDLNAQYPPLDDENEDDEPFDEEDDEDDIEDDEDEDPGDLDDDE